MTPTKKILSYIGAAFLALPLVASAHVKWFAESTGVARVYQITDIPVLIWIAAVIIIVCIGIYLERKLYVSKWLLPHIKTWAPAALSLASIGFGASLVIFSCAGFVFAPNLNAGSGIGAGTGSDNLMLLIQLAAGIMILLGIYERIGALLVLVLYALCVHKFGAYEMLDTLEIVGFAIYAVIVGRPKWRLVRKEWFEKVTHHFHSYAVPILRVGTGLNLIILGFTEKILEPALTQNFLMHYHWNFMQAIGFTAFSDYWFAFSAGVSEALFGLFFLLGLVTRLTISALALFLVTTLILLGPFELVGHLPHFSIAIVLFVLGSGSRLKLINNSDKINS